MDTNDDVAIYEAIKNIKRRKLPFACKEYEATSKEIDLCTHCGHDHAITYYEIGPELAAKIGWKYLAVDSRDGGLTHMNELPDGTDVIGHTQASA